MIAGPVTDVDILQKQAEERVGQTLHGKWRLDRLLGIGGMACVYAATHRNGKRGAVKLLHPEYARSEQSRTRFLREGYVANTVGHRGAVSVLDDDVTDDGTVFLVMELLDGKTIDAIAGSRPAGRLTVGEVLEIADGVLDVLAAAHEKGIVHRDLKPENLLLTTDGVIHILDFGIARLHEANSPSATQTGDTMGTPAFMPPEQALGEWVNVDGRSDLWATGATMFSLLTGRYVHEADTLLKVLLAAMTNPARPISSVRSDVPEDVAAVIDRALALRREDRFQDAREMQEAVRACRARTKASADATPSPIDAPHERHLLEQAPTKLGGLGPYEQQSRIASPQMTASPVASDRTQPAKARRSTLIAMVAVAGLGAVALGVGLVRSAGVDPRLAGPSSAAPLATQSAIPIATEDAEPKALLPQHSGALEEPSIAVVPASSFPASSATASASVASTPQTPPPTTGQPKRPPLPTFTGRH
jgi:serine/threonine-protein kinase